MKTTDFLKEDIGEDAHDMHKDHEVQMARQDCYNAAKDAIALHKLLKNISEMQGLEGWVSEKITLAADYLKTVHDYLEYELISKNEAMPAFSRDSAEESFSQLIDHGLSEDAVSEVRAKEIMPNGNSKGNDADKMKKLDAQIKKLQKFIDQRGDGKTDKKVAAAIDRLAKLRKEKEGLKKTGMKEDASAGASSAGAVATVSTPLMKKPIKRKSK